jgi:hypothetical protein
METPDLVAIEGLIVSLAGLRPVDGGRISVFGRDPWKDPAKVRVCLGFMSDDMPLFAMRIAALLRMVSGRRRHPQSRRASGPGRAGRPPSAGSPAAFTASRVAAPTLAEGTGRRPPSPERL